MFFEHVDIYELLGGPNGPKICARRTKTDFKDRELRDQKRS